MNAPAKAGLPSLPLKDPKLFREQCYVDGSLHAVRPVVTQHDPELRTPQLIHLFIAITQFFRTLDVAVVQGLSRADDHFLGDVTHPYEVGTQRFRHSGFGISQPCDFGDVGGKITHPLQLGHHPQRRNEGPQLTGNGGLTGQQRERARLNLRLFGVDQFVVADHLLSEMDICFEQGGCRRSNRR